MALTDKDLERIDKLISHRLGEQSDWFDNLLTTRLNEQTILFDKKIDEQTGDIANIVAGAIEDMGQVQDRYTKGTSILQKKLEN